MKEVKGIHPNDCLVTDNTITSARNLIQGFPLTPINFADLCNLIEMVVLHERIIMTIPSLVDTSLQPLIDQKIVTSTMFKDATPIDDVEKARVQHVYTMCLRALDKGGIFGRGIMNVDKDTEKSVERAVNRINISDVIFRYERGLLKVTDDAMTDFMQVYQIYKVFTDYADAVFETARFFHIDAYAGCSEIFYPIQNMIKTVPQKIHEKLKELHKDRVDKFLVESGYQSYDIPPFANIVLSRCKSRDDIVPQMIAAREEFSDFRLTCTQYSRDLAEAVQSGTHEDVKTLNNDIEQAFKLLTKKVTANRQDSRLVYRIWDVVKAASPQGILVNLIDFLKQYDIDRETLRAVNGLLNVWSKLQKGSSYEKILRSDLFKDEFREEEFVVFRDYLDSVRNKMSVPVAI